MADDAGERLVVMLEARISEFEKRMKKAERTGTRTYQQLTAGSTRASKAMQADMLRSTAAINRSLAQTSVQVGTFAKGMAAAFVGSAAFSAVSKASQQFTGLQNALKVTGLEGAELDKVFGSLFQIAQKNGTAIEPLVTLYGRAAQAQGELKASSADLMKFTDGVSTALRVAGTSSTQAAGALLQLSQAIGSGVVRAEEFNSVNEGARPILQAVAAGLKEAGGSVSTLKTLVGEGKVSSEAFFRAFLAGMPQIEAQAAKADGTISQASARISNAFILLVGHLDKTTGASGNAANGLNAIGKVLEGLPGYFDAAIKKLEEFQQYLTSIGNSDVWFKIGSFLGADMSPEGLRAAGIEPVNQGGKPKRITITGGTTEPPKIKPVSLADFKVPGQKDAGADADAFKRMTDMIGKRTELLKVEAATIDQTAAARDRARVVVELETAARKANEQAGLKNTEVTAAQREKIEALANAYAKARGELENLNSPLMQFARESANISHQLENLAVKSLDSFGDSIVDAINGTKSLKDAFRDMTVSILNDLAKILIKKAILGPIAGALGGGGGLLGGLLGFADGTSFAPGGPAIVGERGPEIVNLPRGATVTPNHALGGAVTVNGGNTVINISGNADDSTVEKVRAELARRDAEFNSRVISAVQNAQRQRVLT